MQPHKGFRSTDEYIAAFPEDTQALLEAVRAVIKAAAPDAEERISYQMPAFALNGNLVYFAALKNHIGFYPTASGIEAFKAELSMYETTKSSVKFPISQPLPMDLISKIVQFRVTENLNNAAAKAREKKA
ncbi:MAG: iron chaperone [Chloroflexia bacterium]